MSAAELKEMRKEVKKFIDHADGRVLKMVYAMLEADVSSVTVEDCGDLTPEQENILEQRIKKYEKGQMKFSSWTDAKKRIKAK